MIGLSVRRPVAVAMGCTAVAALGVAAFLNVPVELLPDIRYPRLTIDATWPGASPEGVEAFVTTHLEAAAQQVKGAREVSSVSTEGRAQVTVEFAPETEMPFAELELAERLAALEDVLPPRVVPRVEPYVPREFSEQDVPFLEYALYGTLITEGLRAFAEERLRPELLGVEGVTAVRIYGGEPREVRVELDPVAMRALGLTARHVAEAIAVLDVVYPAGKLVRNGMEYVAAVASRPASARDLADIVLVADTAGTGSVVRLGDVARIHDARAEPREYHRIQGRPAITVSIVRRIGTNAIRVADRVKTKLAELRPAFPAGLDLDLRRDESREIRRQLTDLRLRAGASAIVIFLVLLLFLRSFRSAAIVFSTIAFSTLLAVNLLFLSGLSLNILTLAGLAMGFGLIVDNAIVVLESAYRRWRSGEPGAAAAERGARQVALPVIAATLTTVIVFVPFLYLQGELRMYYVPFAYAVGLALLASLLVAFTFVPAVTAKLLRAGAGVPGPRAPSGQPRPPLYVRVYRGLVRLSLRYPWPVVLLAALTFAGSYRLFDKYVVRGPAWGRWGEQTRIDIYVNLPRGSELERADELARHFEAKLATLPEVEEFVTTVRPTSARIRVTFPDSLELTWVPVAIKEQMVGYSHLFGGTEVRVYGFGPSFYGGGASPPNYALKILGYNYERVREIAEELGRRLQRFSRIRDVDTNASGYWFEREKATEIVLDVDRAQLAAYGTSVRDVLGEVAAAVRGRVSWDRLRLGGEEVDVSVKLAGYDRIDTQTLQDLLVPVGAVPVRVGDVARLGERDVLNRIVREDQQYQRIVAYEFRGPVKLGDRVRDAVVGATALPPGYTIERERRWGWIEEEEKRQIYGVLLLAVFLVFVVTAALFESLRGPLVVLLTVPLALIGVFLIFFYTNATFTRSAYIGVIMMAGIVVNNAILLVHHINALRREEALALEPAIVRGTLERVRPILMTTFTTIGGMLPLVLFGAGADENIWNALGFALIGGLASSTVFVLTVLPTVYLLFERRPERRRLRAASPAALIVLLPLLPAIAACSGDGGGTSGSAVIRDSVGIAIVENTAGAWAPGEEWRLSETPIVDIGVLEGAPEYQLFRAFRAVRLSDGRIVVANSGTNELRFYDPAGRYLGSSGRKGGGPGEFEYLAWIQAISGDSILAYDPRSRRISVFDSAGGFARSFTLSPPATDRHVSMHPVGVFSDGSLVVKEGQVFSSTMQLRSGVYRDSLPYFRYTLEGILLDTLRRFPTEEAYVLVEDRGFSVTSVPFGRAPDAVVHGDHLFFGAKETYEIEVYSVRGALGRLVRKAHTNLRITDDDIASAKRQRLEGESDENWRRRLERIFSEIPVPQTMPAYADLEVDAEGNLWVKEYRRPGGEAEWTVFDPEGRALGVVTMPQGFSPIQIGSDFVLGPWRDELDVEHIRLYELIRP